MTEGDQNHPAAAKMSGLPQQRSLCEKLRQKDLRTRILWRLLSTFEDLFLPVDNLRNRWHAKLWGVQVGEDCRFFGKTLFSRKPASSIVIGSRCTFRSRPASNKAGLNRPCMVSTLAEGAVIQIGNHVGLTGTVIGAASSIIIGDDVLCGANTTITDTDWHGIAPDRRRSAGPSAPVHIERNVWLGMTSVVLKGVTIGRDSVVGAGSIVTRSIPPGVICAGQPAKVVRSL